jgi:hypothetical protein
MTMIRIAILIALCFSSACATLTVPPMEPADLAGVPEAAFLGAYDARTLQGGVETQKVVTTYQSQPVYSGGRYAGSAYYPQTTVEITGQIGPNDALKYVAEGFNQSKNNGTIRDISGSAALETRSEMGMDWLAKNDASLPRYLVSIEVKEAEVENMDGVRSNNSLGWTAMVLGVCSPVFLLLTSPCLLYPLFSETVSAGHMAATMRIYDKQASKVVAREQITVDIPLRAKGFHSAEEVFKLMSQRIGQEAGVVAAKKLRAFATGDAPAPMAPTGPVAPPAPTAPTPTPTQAEPVIPSY